MGTLLDLESIIESTVTIKTIPATLFEMQKVLANPDASGSELVEIIEKDPAISAKVVRLANSPIYGVQDPVTAIDVACVLLGFKIIKNLVVQATVLENLSEGPKVEDFSPDWLWDHSFKTAVAARLLCEASAGGFGLDSSEAYTCGLLHDAGKMLLLQSVPKKLGEALRLSKDQSFPLAMAEEKVFGFTSAQVCALLAERWGLGPNLRAAVSRHHDREANSEEWAKGFLIHAASTIAHQVAESGGGWTPELVEGDLAEALGIPEEKLEVIREEVRGVSIVC